MNYLLIDGNNLAVRAAFANEGLTNVDGIPTGVHYGIFQSLIYLKKKFKGYQFLIVWDGKSARRITEASEGVAKGIVPSGYKENRDKGDDMPQPLKDFYAQSAYIQKGIGQTGIPQIRLMNYEADDVIASYAKILKENHRVFVVTSDKDYWQMLDDNVSLWDGMKMEETTKASWKREYGMEPQGAIDIGALCGDDGDNIFGIPSIGMKTAIKELQNHGTWKGFYEYLHDQYDSLREKYPDLDKLTENDERVQGGVDMEKVFNEYRILKSNPSNPTSRLKYPDIYWGIPFSGVMEAFECGEIKIPKQYLMALMFEERAKLAYSLKKMDDDIPDLPIIENQKSDKKKLIEYLEYYDIYTLHEDIEIF